MERAARWLWHELVSAAPAAAYFFAVFQLVAFTDALLLEDYGIHVPTFMLATVAALYRDAVAHHALEPVEARAALTWLAAAKTGVDLSEWEGEFLGSVEERVKTYGRAFGDPEKGAMGEALSVLQTVKLKEITAKAKGEAPKPRFGRKRPPKADRD